MRVFDPEPDNGIKGGHLRKEDIEGLTGQLADTRIVSPGTDAVRLYGRQGDPKIRERF